MMLKNSRIIYYLIVIGLIFNAIFLLFSQINAAAPNELANTGAGTVTSRSSWYSQLEFVGNFILTICSIYSFIIYYKRFPIFLNACYIILLLLISTRSVMDFREFIITPSLLYSPKGLGAWINFGILYFIAEEYYAVKLFRLFRLFCALVILFNLIQLASIGIFSNRNQMEAALLNTTVFLIWVYPFFFFDNTDKTVRAKLLKYVLMGLISFFAFAISSRSYLLITIIYLLIKIRRDLRQRSNALVIFGLSVVAFGGIYYLAANINDFASIKNLFNIFSGRINADSRTGQIKEFMAQFDWDKLFKGVGPLGTWNWSGSADGHYAWLDNQFILIIWWFGLQTGIVYILYLLYTLFSKNPAKNLTITNAKILIFFWILACGGFAIYVSVSSALYFYFITLLIGMVKLKRVHINLLILD